MARHPDGKIPVQKMMVLKESDATFVYLFLTGSCNSHKLGGDLPFFYITECIYFLSPVSMAFWRQDQRPPFTVVLNTVVQAVYKITVRHRSISDHFTKMIAHIAIWLVLPSDYKPTERAGMQSGFERFLAV